MNILLLTHEFSTTTEYSSTHEFSTTTEFLSTHEYSSTHEFLSTTEYSYTHKIMYATEFLSTITISTVTHTYTSKQPRASAGGAGTKPLLGTANTVLRIIFCQ